MRVKCRFHFEIVVVVICAFADLNSASAIDEQKDGGPKRVSFSRGDLPTPLVIPDARGFDGSLQGVATSNGVASAVGVFVDATHDGDPNLPKAKSHGYYVGYPNLRKGDIVPMFSAVYRVQDVWRSGGDSGISFLRLPDKEHKLDLPKEVGVSSGTYVFPLGLRGEGELHDYSVRQYLPDRAVDDPSSIRLIVERSTRSSFATVKEKDKDTRIVSIKKGGILDFGTTKHRLTNIVFPNPKLQVIGWIEISQTPEKESAD